MSEANLSFFLSDIGLSLMGQLPPYGQFAATPGQPFAALLAGQLQQAELGASLTPVAPTGDEPGGGLPFTGNTLPLAIAAALHNDQSGDDGLASFHLSDTAALDDATEASDAVSLGLFAVAGQPQTPLESAAALTVGSSPAAELVRLASRASISDQAAPALFEPATGTNADELAPALREASVPAHQAGAKADAAPSPAFLAMNALVPQEAGDEAVSGGFELMQGLAKGSAAQSTSQTQGNATAASAFSAALQHASAATSQPAAAVHRPIDVPFGQQGWDQALGDRVVWYANQQIQNAEVRLNPPHLGPLEMRISVDNDQASVSFTSHHAAVRDALENAMPRLRDMFADSGLNLVNVNVSQHSLPDQRGFSQQPGSHPSQGGQAGPDLDGGDGVETPEIRQAMVGQGLVDYYA